MHKKTKTIRAGITTTLIAFSAIATLSLVLTPVGGITTLAHAMSQMGSSSENTNFIKYEPFNRHFRLEVPETWSVFDNADGSVSFCNDDTDCHKASEMLHLYSYDIPPNASSDKVFNDILQLERDSNLVITQPPQTVSNSFQKIVFKAHDPTSEQDFVGIGFHKIAQNHLYVAEFISLPEEYQIFLPIVKRITSSWHTIVDDGSNIASSKAFNIQSKILHDRDCANKNLVGNMNVNPRHERFDAGCGMWMNAP